jgi:hypothetical protein
METQQTPERGLDPLLSIDELADCLGLPVRTIYAWRTEGKGPRGVPGSVTSSAGCARFRPPARVAEVEIAEEGDGAHDSARSMMTCAVSAGLVIIGQWPASSVR